MKELSVFDIKQFGIILTEQGLEIPIELARKHFPLLSKYWGRNELLDLGLAYCRIAIYQDDHTPKNPPELPPDSGYIYLLRAENNSYKIGTSIQPKRRLKQIRRSIPMGITVVHYFYVRDAYEVERTLHLKYASARICGEWFALSEEQVKEFCGMEGDA